MASLPHILFGLVFMLNWWKGITTLLVTLIAISSIAVFGWWRSKSNWLSPWLGYSLLPVTVAGLSLLYLPRALAWIAIIVYLPLAIWLIIRIFRQTIKKDWLNLSLMLFPMPIIISWFVAAEWRGYFDSHAMEQLTHFGPWIGVSFSGFSLWCYQLYPGQKTLAEKFRTVHGPVAITLNVNHLLCSGSIDQFSLLLLILSW